MSVATLVKKSTAVRTGHLLKYLKAALRASTVDRSNWFKFAKLKLSKYTSLNTGKKEYEADLQGDFCATFQSGTTPKKAIENAVRYADSEQIKITAVIRKY